MTALVVVGTQWGDEGKGKIVDLLTEQADAVVRYRGGEQRRSYGDVRRRNTYPAPDSLRYFTGHDVDPR